MDVKTAFLNGDLEEEIYMEQPEGLAKPNKNKVIGSNCVIICLYLDDMLILGTNISVVNETKTFLSSQFDMKDLGEVDVILGIKVRKTKNGYSLSQSHYIEKVLKRFNYFDAEPVKTPYDSSKCLKKNKGTGYTHNPNNEHWDALYRLLQYLKGTLNWCLHFDKIHVVLDGYCDANWVYDNDETYIARSTMEAEFIALELAGQEAKWLKNLLADIPLWKKQFVPVSIHCDSQAAIGIAKNSVYNGKKRYIRIRHGIVKQLLKNGVICLDYVRSKNNLARPFTKGLPRKVVLESSRGMGLKLMD
ncbi:retrovirus-related pol polyprotein from transposon TNT 1-94 [Tanacetum coccineum]